MDSLNLLQHAWYLLIGVLLAGYSILDGFDLGVGALLPWLAPDYPRRRLVFNAIGPFWDGNEVWLLAGGGALFAAFPLAYATVFSGFYLALMALLLALVLRAAAIEFHHYHERGRRLWAAVFCASSWLAGLLLGVALGNVIVGVPLDGRGDFIGTFWTLLRPFPLAVGLAGLAAILLQGATWMSLKGSEGVEERARRLRLALAWSFLALFTLSAAAAAIWTPSALERPAAWLAAAAVLAAWAGVRLFSRRGDDRRAFVSSSLLLAALWLLAGTVLYPDLVRASNDPSRALTLHNASSGALTLKIMLLIAGVGMPLAIGYAVFVYRAFRGRVRPAAGDDH